LVDKEVKDILDDSYKRVNTLLQNKERELRELARNLFYFDYLTGEEMESIIKGGKLKKEKIREWTLKE